MPGSGSNLSISGVRALTKPLNACGKHMLFMLKIMTDEYTCIGIRMTIRVMKDVAQR